MPVSFGDLNPTANDIDHGCHTGTQLERYRNASLRWQKKLRGPPRPHQSNDLFARDLLFQFSGLETEDDGAARYAVT